MSAKRDQQIIDTLSAEISELWAVYIFGSTARGEEHAGSDVDIAYLSPATLNATNRFNLQEKLARALGQDVDLVDMLRASPVFQVQVLADGELLHDGDRFRRELFEATALGAYARLNFARAGILADIQERGSVYG